MAAQSSQFICTTFRHEFLTRASAFIGITFAQRVSHAQEVSFDDAKSFVTAVEEEGSETENMTSQAD